MTWLNYSDDEVEKFHPVFERAANKALSLEGLDERLKWEHHIRTPGNRLVPDYVLCERDSGRWRVAVEIKRTKTSIYSTRNQIQAKGYAENNSDLYHPGSPRYFSLTNLEQIILFALKDGSPPNECRLKNGQYIVGPLLEIPEEDFQHKLTNNMRDIYRCILGDDVLEFDDVWPGILIDFVQQANLVIGTSIDQPKTPNWELVRDYFCHPIEIDTARIFLLRCLLAEYIRGVLERFNHPDARHLIPLKSETPSKIGQSIANTFTRLRDVDFRSIFKETYIEIYRNLPNPEIRQHLSDYIRGIVTPPSIIGELARDRLDRDEFLEGLISITHEGEKLDEKGKVITDPELASLLSHLMVSGPDIDILDPCCGGGALLEAAYDQLVQLNISHNDILSQLHGFEVDPVLMYLAIIRLILKDPASIRPESSLDITHSDMFANMDKIKDADVILMNPPFKRYEAQDVSPVPPNLKSYYTSVIETLSGSPAVATSGQQNFYTYYIELILKAVKEGAKLGIILDNKWYHNKYAQPLKKLLLDLSSIEAIIEYPYSNLFSGWTIATSILICRKTSNIPPNHRVKFIRCSLDLSQVNLKDVASHFENDLNQLSGWACREVEQGSLDYRVGWKNYFEDSLNFDFREGMPTLPSLFQFKRRGSLAKEEGGMSALAFPFSRSSFGYLRRPATSPRRRYQTERVKELTPRENAILKNLSSTIPESFHGYAINNPDRLSSYILTESQLLVQPTVEPPSLRGSRIFWTNKKTPWTKAHQEALSELQSDEAVNNFINEFRRITGLDYNLMPNEWLWVGLKEPYAGELIIPRKMRIGHRVYINPFACEEGGRQVRVSSNFVSFSYCNATDDSIGLDRLTATKLIASFLVSSFGQLQFEMKGYNREGLLSTELHHLKEVHVVDPRTIPKNEKIQIIEVFDKLPYPIPTNTLSSQLQERNTLDQIFARVICSLNHNLSEEDLLAEVHQLLDEYILARNP